MLEFNLEFFSGVSYSYSNVMPGVLRKPYAYNF